MSWLFSQALVAAFSEATCLDGGPSAQLNVMPTPHPFWHRDKTTDFSSRSPSGLTCAVLTDAHGEALLTWFREVSRARTSAAQAGAPASAASDPAYGEKWRVSLARYDRATSSWRTAQTSFFGESDESSVTWPNSGMTRAGLCWERSTLAPRIGETAGGVWPTPTVNGNHNRAGLSAKSGDGLATAVAKWPTPKAADHRIGMPERYKGALSMGGRRSNLNDAAARFPTPSTIGINGGSHSRAAAKKRGIQEHELHGGSLNPTWVEWLMGWPLGWTDCAPLETARFRQWQQQHGKS